jgi:hypothetical protein
LNRQTTFKAGSFKTRDTRKTRWIPGTSFNKKTSFSPQGSDCPPGWNFKESRSDGRVRRQARKIMAAEARAHATEQLDEDEDLAWYLLGLWVVM